MNAEDYLTRLLPHRLDALEVAVLMLNFRLKWGEPKPMQVFVGGLLQFEGRTTMFTNPAFEVGVLHARALLEFIGLKVSNGRLVQVIPSARKNDDAAIEKLVGSAGPLPLVTPYEAGAIHPPDPKAAKRALARVVMAAHKGLAHSSATYFSSPIEAEEALLALQLTQQLVERHVYAPLGRQRPPLPIEARPRA